MAGIGIIVALVIVVGIIVFLFSGMKPGVATTTVSGTSSITQTTAATTIPQPGKGISAPVMATDPEHAPAGTQAVIITYSSLAVHASGASGSGWVNASGGGTLNLTSVINASKVIGYVNVSSNATINLVRFNISSARIIINGTSSNVALPNNNFTLAVVSNTKINQSSGAAVLIDIAPSVTAVYSQNSTTFIMAPAAKATVIANVSASAKAGVGASVSLNAEAEASLAAAAPNITITNAYISISGNVTSIGVTVKDNSNGSAALNNLFIYGNQSVEAVSSTGANTSLIAKINGRLNGSGLVGGNMSSSASLKTNLIANLGISIMALKAMDFAINANGALSLPSSGASFRSSGFTVAGGSTGSMTFAGELQYNSNTLIVRPKAGSRYRITVAGPDGAEASTTVTAG
jgi:hypothetical protein